MTCKFYYTTSDGIAKTQKVKGTLEKGFTFSPKLAECPVILNQITLLGSLSSLSIGKEIPITFNNGTPRRQAN